jgi:hypothetical protein
VFANGVSGFPGFQGRRVTACRGLKLGSSALTGYARQCLMVSHADAGSIPARSTNSPFAYAERHSAGLNWFRRVSLMVRSSCRKWTLSISAYQTKTAKNILAKVAGFLKSLVPDFSFGEFAPAAMAA